MWSRMFVIHAAGGSETGVGHLSRCRSLAVELLRRRAGPVVLVYEALAEIAEKFCPPGAQLMVASSRMRAVKMREEALRKTGKTSSVLITDLLQLGENDAAFARRQGFQTLVHLNDSGLPAYAADLVVDGDAFKNGQQSSVVGASYLCGAAYHIVEPSVVARRPAQPWNKAAVETVLLCFGGADPDRQTEFFVHETSKRRSTVTFTVAAGPAFSPQRCEVLASLAGPNYRFVRGSSGMADFILEHDVVVTLGGLTSYEAMCLGRAVFAVAWAHMAPYVEQLDAVGLLNNLGSGEGTIDHLYLSVGNTESVRRLARAGYEAIDGRGAERVIGVILSGCKA
jgi:spore coat polysaccharide biosynthesis predicted glycosyltransferase SpsG